MSFQSLVGRGLLLIYQMPKTGSQTVEATLQECHVPQMIYRFHFLSPEIARSMRHALRSGNASEQWKSDARHQLKAMGTIKRMICIRRLAALVRIGWPKLHIITGVREPIALALSSVFENHAFLFSNLEMATPEACRTELLRPKALTHIQNWFDLEIKQMTGIDVYERPFPWQEGYAIYENSFARLLVYRSDFLDKLPELLSSFVGCQVRGLTNRNCGASKNYAKAYAEAKAGLRLPESFVSAQYEKKLVRHFFSPEERRRLLLRWCGRRCEQERDALPCVA